jgi:AraC-like DNA-binding protein
VLSAKRIVARPQFAISAVTCRNDNHRWSATEVNADYTVVLVRSGRFRRRIRGTALDLDPTMAYVAVPGEEQQFAHPAGGDICTAVCLGPVLWRTVAGDETGPVRPTAYVDGWLELVHRRILAAADAGDVDYAVTEQLLELLGRTIGTVATAARSAAADRRLVAAAREAILTAHPAARGLLPLAEMLGVSPYRLSRAFPREVGVSLTRYRNRVRVGAALDRVAGGERNLAALAADLGFADQAHMSRTVREHLGHTPGALRRLLDTSRAAGKRSGGDVRTRYR